MVSFDLLNIKLDPRFHEDDKRDENDKNDEDDKRDEDDKHDEDVIYIAISLKSIRWFFVGAIQK